MIFEDAPELRIWSNFKGSLMIIPMGVKHPP